MGPNNTAITTWNTSSALQWNTSGTIQRNSTSTPSSFPNKQDWIPCQKFWSLKVYYCFCVAIVLIAVWIVVANSMILYAPFIYKPLQRKSYMFVSSLAAADLITAFLVPAAWFMGVIGEYLVNKSKYDLISLKHHARQGRVQVLETGS